MIDLSRKFTDQGRLVVTVLLVGTLVLGAAAGVDWLRDYLTSADDSASGVGGCRMTQAADQAAGDDGEGMIPHGHTKAQPSGCCLTPIVLNPDNSNSRLRSANKVAAEAGVLPDLPIDRLPTLTSSSRIHSGLGRQFTLVGAHPSGTS